VEDIAKPLPATTVLPYAWVILAVVFLASVAAPLNQAKVPPLMPVIMEAFQLSLGQAGWLMSVFALTGLFLSLPAGIFLQKLGPKTLGVIALVCLSVGGALGALAARAGLLLASRVIEGVGMGLIAVVAPAVIAMWFPPARQGVPMGIWATWVPVGSVIMFALGPALTIRAGWQIVWWISAGFSLAILVVYGLLMKLPPWMEGRRRSGKSSTDLRESLSNRSAWLLALEFGCNTLTFMAIGTFFPTYLSEVRGYTLAQAAFITSLSTLVVLVSAPLAGWFLDRIGSRRLMLSIPFLVVAVMMLFPFKVVGWQIYVFMILLGFVGGAVPTATFAAAPEVMGKAELAGLGLAMVMVGQNLGMFIGPVLFGNLVERLGWVVAGYWLVPICLLGFVLSWKVKVR
jgi:MFS family permease